MNWKCRVFGHKGRENGGLVYFTCTRCRTSQPQTHPALLAAAPRIFALEEIDQDAAHQEYLRVVKTAGGDPNSDAAEIGYYEDS